MADAVLVNALNDVTSALEAQQSQYGSRAEAAAAILQDLLVKLEQTIADIDRALGRG